MEVVQQLLNIGKTLKLIDFVPGQIKLRFSTKTIKLLHQLSAFDELQHINPKQFIYAVEGINKININPLFASITIQFEKETWAKSKWENLCNGRQDDVLTQYFINALSKLKV